MEALGVDHKHHFPQHKVVAQYIGDIGWGLFAEKDFAPGDCLCWLSLGNTANSEIIPWDNSFGEYFDRSYTVTPGYAWCASPSHPFWYINHSCCANSGFVNWGRAVHGNIPVVAHQPIACGEQITLDYALFTASYDGDPSGGPWKMTPCLCHSEHCRGVITGFHRLPLDLQREAILPQGDLQGRVPAHMMMELPTLIRVLQQSSPGQYSAYLNVLQQQMALSKKFFTTARRKVQPVKSNLHPLPGLPAAWAERGL